MTGACKPAILIAMTKDDTETEKTPARHKGPRVPRKVTRQSLENAALAYLGRFTTTAKGLSDVLMRRVQRSARYHGSDPAEGAALIAAIVTRYRQAGLIDDTTFAEGRARTLFERGLPLRAIALRLRQKGVGADDVATALARLDPDADRDDPAAPDARALDRTAARTFARRRLGPWRKPDSRDGIRERDLATLARAGFSYGIARETIDGTTEEDDDV